MLRSAPFVVAGQYFPLRGVPFSLALSPWPARCWLAPARQGPGASPLEHPPGVVALVGVCARARAWGGGVSETDQDEAARDVDDHDDDVCAM